MALGSFAFVLHYHQPYVCQSENWRFGEEWIHQAATEAYLPLLRALYDLRDEDVAFRLTISLSPVLAEQFADPLVIDHLDQFLSDRIAAAEADMAQYHAPDNADPHLYYLANWYRDRFESVRQTLNDRFQRDIIGAYRRLQDEGVIEIATSAATHAYLPLLSEGSSTNAQLQTAVTSYERLFGRSPRLIWLPECGYRPGMETVLEQFALTAFFTESFVITGGQLTGVATGDAIGGYEGIARHYGVPNAPVTAWRDKTTFQPYRVQDSKVAVIGRNERAGYQVWSTQWGYPGDFDYREYDRKSGISGLRYWRVTGVRTDLHDKDYYHPEWAGFKVDQHAEHFAHLVGDLLRHHHNETGTHGLLCATYNGELFGQRWFEGSDWFEKTMRHVASNPDVHMTTISDHLEQTPPTEPLSLPESSWGVGGLHFIWDNTDTHWMWQPIHEAERRMAALAAKFTDPTAAERTVLKQAARELLLLQSDDWQFFITTGLSSNYAVQRFNQHLDGFNQLADSLDTGKPDTDLAADLWDTNSVFPDIDYRWFANEKPFNIG